MLSVLRFSRFARGRYTAWSEIASLQIVPLTFILRTSARVVDHEAGVIRTTFKELGSRLKTSMAQACQGVVLLLYISTLCNCQMSVSCPAEKHAYKHQALHHLNLLGALGVCSTRFASRSDMGRGLDRAVRNAIVGRCSDDTVSERKLRPLGLTFKWIVFENFPISRDLHLAKALDKQGHHILTFDWLALQGRTSAALRLKSPLVGPNLNLTSNVHTYLLAQPLALSSDDSQPVLQTTITHLLRTMGHEFRRIRGRGSEAVEGRGATQRTVLGSHRNPQGYQIRMCGNLAMLAAPSLRSSSFRTSAASKSAITNAESTSRMSSLTLPRQMRVLRVGQWHRRSRLFS